MGYHAPREVHTRTGFITKQTKQRDAPLMSTRAEDSTVSAELAFTRGWEGQGHTGKEVTRTEADPRPLWLALYVEPVEAQHSPCSTRVCNQPVFPSGRIQNVQIWADACVCVLYIYLSFYYLTITISPSQPKTVRMLPILRFLLIFSLQY